MDVAAYALGCGALALMAAISVVIFVQAMESRRKIWRALMGHHVPQADLEAPHASASTQLRRDRSAVEPTRETA
jgi:divalent metal cation (Fe/Co/Zn/Cd) transporter